MTFETILDRAFAMLQRCGGGTYFTLKRLFTPEDMAVEDRKNGFLDEPPQVIDRPGQGLISKADPPSTLRPLPQEAHPISTGPSSTDPHPPHAERRQLTVMFCDLVDSTPLAGRLDPEDFRDVVCAYLETCATVIQRFDGHIAKYLGDGILVYFGYPQAHEDDAQRAVLAGLGIVEALGPLNERLTRERGLRLAVRLGIHTGLVVAGELSGGPTREPLAIVGETPNIAARLQSMAEPDTVMISGSTHRLVQGFFACQDLGLCQLKGVSTPLRVHRVHGERAAESRFEAVSAMSLTPLIGREEELTLVLRRWEQARTGKGQVVLVSGEPGIGKSRLLQAVHERVGTEPHIRFQYQCSPYHTQSAFYPMIMQLERAAHFEPADTPTQKLDKLEALLAQTATRVAEVLPLVAALLSIPVGDRCPPLKLSPLRQKTLTIAALIEQMTELSRRQPVVCLVEDAHWCDPTTLEVLEQLVHRVQELRVLVVITARPEFSPPWAAPHVTALTLAQLSQAHTATMVACLTADKALPSEVLAQIINRTDGVPLFVEELTRTVLESGLLREQDGRYALTSPLPSLTIPATLQDSLMARLDRLAPVKEMAQLGATLGRAFPYTLLRAVSPWDDAALQRALAQLMEAELLYQQGAPPRATYLFKHALIQEAAYQSMLKRTREQHHRRIAQALEAQFPETCERQPELVAHHYTVAGMSAAALPYWQRAGQLALERSAHLEAIAHLTKGLEVVATLPDPTERARQELHLQTTLGPVLIAVRGAAAPAVEQAYARARELCQQVGGPAEHFAATWGLWVCTFVRGALATGREYSEQLLAMAQRVHDPALELEAHLALGAVVLRQGEVRKARAHLEAGLTYCKPLKPCARRFPYGQDPGVACCADLALTLWLLGYPAQAVRRQQEALSRAQALAHPFSRAFALLFAAWLAQHRLEVPATQQWAEAAITVATDHGFPLFGAQAKILRGWAQVAQGKGVAGLIEMREGLAACRATGAGLFQPYYLALLAEAAGHLGRLDEALHALAEAQAAVATGGEHFYAAELLRLKGELRLEQMGRSGLAVQTAEGCFRQALAIARGQNAKALELRAAVSLSRLWQQRDQREEARALLAEVYGWFTEGFDTADLQTAKALLGALSN